jgi:hypothetical protein
MANYFHLIKKLVRFQKKGGNCTRVKKQKARVVVLEKHFHPGLMFRVSLSLLWSNI